MAKVAQLLTIVRNRLGPSDKLSHRDFLPHAQEIMATPPSPVRTAFLLAICALFAVALAVSWFGEIDIYAVADGRIQPSGRSKVVQPIESGRIRKIYVRNGMSVRAGDLLVTLDPTEVAADRKSLDQQVGALSAEIARRKTAIRLAQAGQLDDVPVIPFPSGLDRAFIERENTVLTADLAKLHSTVDVSRSKMAEDIAKQRALIAKIKADQRVAETQAERVAMREDLERQGWESRSNVIDANEELEKQNSTLADERGQLPELDTEIRTLKTQIDSSIAQFVADNAQSLADAEQKHDEHTQDLVKAQAKFGYTRLTAPIDGVIQELGVTTIGQVVQAGQQLMTVVPRHDVLEVEALVKNEDVGFIKPGAKAVIKIDSFPFTRYGTISGVVRSISHDAVDIGEARQSDDTQQTPVSPQNSATAPTPKMNTLVFPVVIELEKSAVFADGQNVPLSAGMSVSAEIRTGQRRVIDYVLSPLDEVTSDAAHER